ncbi:MAG: hypothetical protein J5802_08120, partial [Butyrivibrio sp.]|nr:hypothetical protein [Butyrivibrio sp.]
VIPDVHLKPWIYDMADSIFYQVVGHTPVEEPLDLGGVLTLDLFSTYSNGDAYGNQKLYIVDTATRKYEEARNLY